MNAKEEARSLASDIVADLQEKVDMENSQMRFV